MHLAVDYIRPMPRNGRCARGIYLPGIYLPEDQRRIRDRTAHIERLEHDRDTLLSYYSQLAAERLGESRLE
jgi:hypothetical protein